MNRSNAPKKSVSNTKKNYSRATRPWWIIPLALAVIAVGLVVVFVLPDNEPPGASAPAQAPAGVSEQLPVEITVAEANARFNAGAYLLDVRTPEEWNEFHVEGSTLIPLNELQSRVNEVPQDREVVVVCRSGNRSQEGRDILLNAGWTQVSSMAGGLTDWRAAGYPTVSGP